MSSFTYLRSTRNSLIRSYLEKNEPTDELQADSVGDNIPVTVKTGSEKRSSSTSHLDDESSAKKRKKEKIVEPPKIVGNRDVFCWRCHKSGDCIECSSCPRVFHLKCAQIETKPSGFWPCIECDAVERAESASTRSLNRGDLAELLSYNVERMKSYTGSEHYCVPVDTTEYDDYLNYILKPMDISHLLTNVNDLKYGSTESFLSDAKWMVHNSYIYNSAQSHLTVIARGLLKIARQECEEIDNCQDCYRHAHTLPDETWFIEPCERPHLLVWARLKGFPYWPGKVMKLTGKGVDVRFFGDHNRAIVPPAMCLLYSKKPPHRSKEDKVPNLDMAVEEIEAHISKLKSKFKCFEYGEFRTELNSDLLDEYIAKMLPKLGADSMNIKEKNTYKQLYGLNSVIL